MLKMATMIVERTKNEIIFRIPGNVDFEELQDLSDWFKFLEISRKSKAKQDDVDILVNEIKKGRWERRKSMLMK